MPEFLSPGVVIEQVPATANVTEGVSTSTMGLAGFTKRGPENDATLVTDFRAFQRIFGGFVRNARVPDTMAHYFSNGGRRAYVVRTVPADATKASAKILSKHTNDNVLTATGIAAVVATNLTTGFAVNGGDSPVQPESVSVKWRAAGTPFVASQAKARDNTTNLAGVPGTLYYEGRVPTALLPAIHESLLRLVPGATTSIGWLSATVAKTIAIAAPLAGSSVSVATNGAGSMVTFDFRTGIFSLSIAPSENPDASPITVTATPTSGDPGAAASSFVGSLPDGRVTFVADNVGAAGNSFTVTVVDPAPTNGPLTAVWSGSALVITLAVSGGVLDAANNQAGQVASAVNAVTAGDITATPSGTGLDPLTVAVPLQFFTGGRDTSAYFEIVDNGAGALVDAVGDALTVNGTINYATGAFAFTTQTWAIPYNTQPLLGTYSIQAWSLSPSSKGAWAQDMRVLVQGDNDTFDAATASYARQRLLVDIFDEGLGSYVNFETFTNLDLTDADSTRYMLSVINEASSLIVVDSANALESPPQLNGIRFTRVLAGGDQSTGGRIITQGIDGNVAPLGIAKRSVVITYTSANDGLLKSIVDNGAGKLTGSVDPGGVNTIGYLTGAVSFTTADPIKAGTIVLLAFYQSPEATLTEEVFGDTDKGYTAGSDGSLTDPLQYGRDQLTAPSLQGNYQGLYALDRVDAVLQVIIPDAAGDLTMTKDVLDYVDGRESLASGPDRFAIIVPPSSTAANAQDTADWKQFELARFSKYAALYSPWVIVPDNLASGRTLLFPPLGHLAGIYARTDTSKNVAKAPAGVVDGQLRAIDRLQTKYAKGEQDLLSPLRINCMISTALAGNVVWGARTLAQENAWKYIQAVRTLMFLAQSIYVSTQGVVFETNGSALRTRVRTQITGFLNRLFGEGYFAGDDASQAFFVICDDTNNTPETVDLGRLIVDIGFAPTKPAEFVVFRIGQKST